MCEDCETYVAIFDTVDEAHQRRVINLQATKKYQEKQGDAFKIAHLLSTKKKTTKTRQNIQGSKSEICSQVPRKGR